MGAIELIVFVVVILALVIPIFAIFTDSPLGRALARRLESHNAPPPEIGELSKRVDLLESELEDLSRGVDTLREENQFLQRLIEDGSNKPQLPPSPPS